MNNAWFDLIGESKKQKSIQYILIYVFTRIREFTSEENCAWELAFVMLRSYWKFE